MQSNHRGYLKTRVPEELEMHRYLNLSGPKMSAFELDPQSLNIF